MNPSHGESREEIGGSDNNIGSKESSPSRSVEEHQRTSASAGAAAGGSHAQTEGGGQGVYGREEVSALKGIFSLYDAENTGTIGVKELEGILQKVGHNPGAKLSRMLRYIYIVYTEYSVLHPTRAVWHGTAYMLRGTSARARGGRLI